jgi:hypothetical protein
MFIWLRFALLLTCGQKAETKISNILIFIVLSELSEGGKSGGIGKAFT